MKIFKITPMDRKGEIDGNTFYTDIEGAAANHHINGCRVQVAEIKEWSPVTGVYIKTN